MDDALTVHRLHFSLDLGWARFGMALVAVSFTVTYRRFAGKVSAAPGEGYGRPLAGTGGRS